MPCLPSCNHSLIDMLLITRGLIIILRLRLIEGVVIAIAIAATIHYSCHQRLNILMKLLIQTIPLILIIIIIITTKRYYIPYSHLTLSPRVQRRRDYQNTIFSNSKSNSIIYCHSIQCSHPYQLHLITSLLIIIIITKTKKKMVLLTLVK